MNSPHKDILQGIEVEALRTWDREHVWHPFTPMSPYMEGHPPVIARAEGFRLRTSMAAGTSTARVRSG